MMEWYLAGFAGAVGVADAITTHIGLQSDRAEEANPLWRHLYPRLPLLAFFILLAGGQCLISMLLFFLLGEIGQISHLAVYALAPLSNAVVIYKTRRLRIDTNEKRRTSDPVATQTRLVDRTDSDRPA